MMIQDMLYWNKYNRLAMAVFSVYLLGASSAAVKVTIAQIFKQISSIAEKCDGGRQAIIVELRLGTIAVGLFFAGCALRVSCEKLDQYVANMQNKYGHQVIDMWMLTIFAIILGYGTVQLFKYL
jgi:hypothetical protein